MQSHTAHFLRASPSSSHAQPESECGIGMLSRTESGGSVAVAERQVGVESSTVALTEKCQICLESHEKCKLCVRMP